MLDINVKELPGGAVAYLRGQADGETSTGMLRSLVDLLETHPPRLVVVMNDLEFIDSRGLGALIGVYHRAEEQQCQFRLVTADPQIMRIMQITGLCKVMPMCASEGEALLPAP
jgi:anti-anti-sigma factor